MAAPPKRNETATNLDAAFERTCQSLVHDMPALFHGTAGWNGCTNETASLLATLTAQYMHSMVQHAVETCQYQFPTHQITPPFVRRKQKRTNCFDDPLPTPKIRKQTSERSPQQQKQQQALENRPQNNNSTTVQNWDQPTTTATLDQATTTTALAEHEDEHDAWVGASGVELGRNHNNNSVGLHSAHFLFLHCHDPYTYHKIRTLLKTTTLNTTTTKLAATTNTMLLEDPVVQATILEEAAKERVRVRPVHKHKTGAKEDEEDDDDDDEASLAVSDDDTVPPPSWPNLERLLPAYRDKV